MTRKRELFAGERWGRSALEPNLDGSCTWRAVSLTSGTPLGLLPEEVRDLDLNYCTVQYRFVVEFGSSLLFTFCDSLTKATNSQ